MTVVYTKSTNPVSVLPEATWTHGQCIHKLDCHLSLIALSLTQQSCVLLRLNRILSIMSLFSSEEPRNTKGRRGAFARRGKEKTAEASQEHYERETRTGVLEGKTRQMIFARMIVTCLSCENFISKAYPVLNLLTWLHPSWSLHKGPPWRCSIKDNDIFRSTPNDKQVNFNRRHVVFPLSSPRLYQRWRTTQSTLQLPPPPPRQISYGYPGRTRTNRLGGKPVFE